jgi:hypothetical protein
MNNMDYWYDGQIRRYLIQLVRVFSHFEIAENTSDGVKFNRVPCKYASSSRQVAQILKGNSENVLNSAPQITVALEGISIARDRTQDPFNVDTRQVAEREWDGANGRYTSEQGNLYTTQRYMPVPYDLTIQVDIWTTNTDAKLQILEQLFVLFNPAIELQSNDNPLDWSNVFTLELDTINWSSRSVPAGTEDTLDIATMTFTVPIWISPPAKVTRQKIIQKIVADIYTLDQSSELPSLDGYTDFFANIPEDSRFTITPNNYWLELGPDTATLTTSGDVPQIWQDLIEMQGELGTSSRLEVNLSDDQEDFSAIVVGIVSASGDDSVLNFSLDTDTLPGNTLDAVDRIIDPIASTPGFGIPAEAVGQRYLLINGFPPGSNTANAWGLPSAVENTILEYQPTGWVVSFDPDQASSPEYITNNATNEQFRWTGEEWISSWQGTYNPGYWRLIL